MGLSSGKPHLFREMMKMELDKKPIRERHFRLEISRETAIALAATVEVAFEFNEKMIFENYQKLGGSWDKIELRKNLADFEDKVIKGKEIYK